MKRKRNTEPQIVAVLQQADNGTTVAEVCREPGRECSGPVGQSGLLPCRRGRSERLPVGWVDSRATIGGYSDVAQDVAQCGCRIGSPREWVAARGRGSP